MSEKKNRGQKRKAKDKIWYRLQDKRKKCLNPGLKGFLLFCNKDEKQTIREANILLNESADKLYGDEMSAAPSTEDEVEIDDLLEKEKSALKLEEKAEKRFQVVGSGVRNVLFMKTTVPDPLAVVEHVLSEICRKKEQKTRHLVRLLPIQITCKANENSIKENFKKALHFYLENHKEVKETLTYQVMFKSRCNQDLCKEVVFRIVRDVVMFEQSVSFKVDLVNPNVCFNFEVMKGNCCIGILPDYLKYRKYNLIELGQHSVKEIGDSEAIKDD